MINFFRKIRQQLLSENRFSKYLIYAIGEIILVVIGILIALWINNWNNHRQTKKLERKYLIEIKNNLTSDLKDIEFNIEFNEDKLYSNELILDYLNNDNAYHDSLNFHFSNLTGSTRSVANMSAYENLKSRGLEIISSDSLRQAITNVYSNVYHNIIDFEKQDDHQHQYQVLWTEVIKTINIKGMWQEGKPIDKEKIKKNYPFKNAITTNIFFRRYMISLYKSLNKRVNELIKMIQSEIDK